MCGTNRNPKRSIPWSRLRVSEAHTETSETTEAIERYSAFRSICYTSGCHDFEKTGEKRTGGAVAGRFRRSQAAYRYIELRQKRPSLDDPAHNRAGRPYVRSAAKRRSRRNQRPHHPCRTGISPGTFTFRNPHRPYRLSASDARLLPIPPQNPKMRLPSPTLLPPSSRPIPETARA